MSGASKIEWTDATWNPIRGCTRVSEGCRNCYAERIAARFSGPGAPFEGVAKAAKAGPRWTGRVELIEARLTDPLRWRKPRRIFVNSMSDLFHEALPYEATDKVFAIMLACEVLENLRGRHTFQVLTKRPEVARDYLGAPPVDLLRRWAKAGDGLVTLDDEDTLFSEVVMSACSARWSPERVALSEFSPWSRPENLFPLSRLLIGTSVEDQPTADARIPELLRCPAAVRFVSYEPALAAVDFRWWLKPRYYAMGVRGQDPIPALDWIIAGGESGPGARPSETEWFRSVRDQCVGAGASFFFKQWGQWAPYDQLPEGTRVELGASGAQLFTDLGPIALGKKRTGRELDGVVWDQHPRVSEDLAS